jgi:G3E family GTPase
VVDGKHIWNHLTVRRESEVLRTSRGSALGEVVVIGQEEVASQIAYADRVIVNKVDLIEKDDDDDDDSNREHKKEDIGLKSDKDLKSEASEKVNTSKHQNKSSLSSQDKKKRGLEDVCKAIRSLNPRADILKATNGKVALNQLLGIKAFDLKCQVYVCMRVFV